jgi:hypothetical protein
VPGSASLHLALPVEPSARADADHMNLFASAEARLPRHALSWMISARIEEANTIVLEIQNSTADRVPLEGVFFFPYDTGLIENAEPQVMTVHPGPAGQAVTELRIPRAHIPSGAITRAQGVLVAASGLGDGAGPAAIEIDVPVTPR